MLDSSLFSAETSFEEQFSEMEDRIEVMAPAGKLGMVIDTPAGGVPIVHAIKESSVLAKQVQVGDRLVSVDDEDTTGMTAMQVSKLISLRADSDSRTLVFVRNKPRRVKQDP
jgi:C-terminal processing protease CtpA/Prc